MTRQPKYLNPYWKARIEEADEQFSAAADTLAAAIGQLTRLAEARPRLVGQPEQLAECDALIKRTKHIMKQYMSHFKGARETANIYRQIALEEYADVVKIKTGSVRYPHYDYIDISDSDCDSGGFAFQSKLINFMNKREHKGFWFASESFDGYRRFHLRSPKARSIVFAKLFLQ